MSPSFLIAGATGNTGTGVVETLSELLKSNTRFSKHRILALTRSRDSVAAQELARLPRVEVIEQNWVEISVDWLRENDVERAFIASHNQPNQFAEESTFLLNALLAGVSYVVRISTTAANVRPDCKAYYPRTHWAIETMLSTPEFRAMGWTSLQPNIFSTAVLGAAAEYVKQYRKSGKLEKFTTMLSADAPVALVAPNEVGVFAAHLLAEDDISKHNNKRYVLNGRSDVNGEMLARMVENAIEAELEEVEYQDVSFVDGLVAATKESHNVMTSIRYAVDSAHAAQCTAATTSREVLEIAPTRVTIEDIWSNSMAA